MKKELVTVNQAKLLKKLGFKRPTQYYYFEGKVQYSIYEDNWNSKDFPPGFLSVPNVDQTIEWIRSKFGIHVICCWVRHMMHNDKCFLYKYGVLMPYNSSDAGIRIGCKRTTTDIFAAKREAITMAINRINKNTAKVVKMPR